MDSDVPTAVLSEFRYSDDFLAIFRFRRFSDSLFKQNSAINSEGVNFLPSIEGIFQNKSKIRPSTGGGHFLMALRMEGAAMAACAPLRVSSASSSSLSESSAEELSVYG